MEAYKTTYQNLVNKNAFLKNIEKQPNAQGVLSDQEVFSASETEFETEPVNRTYDKEHNQSELKDGYLPNDVQDWIGGPWTVDEI